MKTKKNQTNKWFIPMALSCLSFVACNEKQATKVVSHEVKNPVASVEQSKSNQPLKTDFYLKCVQSLDEKDADSDLRIQIANAIALVNTSKVAKSVPVTKDDFHMLAKRSYENEQISGLVNIGTIDKNRELDSSYTHYVFSRLPSGENYDSFVYPNLNFLNGTTSEHFFDYTHADFSMSDRSKSIVKLTSQDLAMSQDPLVSIDAKRIESYTQDDCEKIATYMANAGTETLSKVIDEPTFRANKLYPTSSEIETSKFSRGHKIKDHEGIDYVISDHFDFLNRRWENLRGEELKASSYRDSDSKRIIVLQDNLLRSGDNGDIDYSFLDLINMPHLRFFAAVDSKIGLSKMGGNDFDRDTEGKNVYLVNFVERHQLPQEMERNQNHFKGLEAVFVKLEEEKQVEVVEPHKPRPARNLFHVPGGK